MNFHPLTRQLKPAAMLAAGLMLAAGAARADDDRRSRTPPAPAVYAQECGSCHVAYPAGLLPAESWRRLMNGLLQHFGTDASTEAEATRQIAAWLDAHAGSGKRARSAPPEDRITRSAWFQREHREVDAATWQRPAVKTPANCAACHAGAAQGDFDDDRVRIPR